MRLIISLLFGLLFVMPLYVVTQINETQLKHDLQQAESNSKMPNQAEVVQALQGAINWLVEAKESEGRARQYQMIIDRFPELIKEVRQQLAQEDDKPLLVPPNLTANDLEQQILKTNSQLLHLTRQMQQEQERSREITDAIEQVPLQQSEARRSLNEIKQRLQSQSNSNTPLAQAQFSLLQAEATARKAKVNELELSQLSANNRQELSRMRAELYKKRHERVDALLQNLRNKLNNKRQQEAEKALERTELVAEQGADLPESINKELETNRMLSHTLNQQAQRMDLISSQQRQATAQALQVRQALSTIREQAQWLGVSTALKEILRVQVAKLPNMPKPQQLDRDMVQLRVQQLTFEDMLEKQQQAAKPIQDDGSPLTVEEQHIFDMQLLTQRELISSLLSGYDSQILELTKLKKVY